MKIIGTGSALPEQIVTNEDLTKFLDTSDEWIVSHTGIRERRVLDRESVNDIGTLAARRALEDAGLALEELDLLICSNVASDYFTPGPACFIAGALGFSGQTLDINGACTGFLQALDLADAYLRAGKARNVLIVAAEKPSYLADWTDRATCVLFGDGAGAAVVALRDEGDYACVLGARGDPEMLWAQGPGDQVSALHMDGKGVFRFATQAMPECVEQLLEKSGLTAEDIAWFVPHQANARIVAFSAKRLGIPLERFYQNMDRYGNTSAASIPIALDEMAEQKLLDPGQRIICVGFGAGLTWGGVLLTW